MPLARLTLTAADRCDECGARAYWRVVMPATLHDLCFCNHHYRKHETAFIASEYICYDDLRALYDGMKLDVSA